MEKNIIEKYELIDGHAIIDMNYNIITANEEMYRFIGISTMTSILESIHQVDLDDFMDVAHHLRQDQEADMVIRIHTAGFFFTLHIFSLCQRTIRLNILNCLHRIYLH